MAPHSGEIVNEAPTAFALLGRRPAVRRWVTARVCSGAAVTLLRASFLWQIYDLTKSPAMLGLTGLLSFVPAPVSSLLGGAIADAVDRRKVILVAQAVALVCALFLTFSDASSSIVPLIALVVTNAAATAFEAPARQAMLPNLVPRDEFARAVTVMATAQSLAFMTGPALAGVLIGHGGVRFAFGVASALYVASIFFVRGLPTNAPTEAGLRGVSVAALREGLTFVLRNRPVLGAMTLDLFAVIFGGASALLPVYANDILAVGPRGYGVLTSALEVGAVLTSVLLLVLPPIRRVGRAIVLGVAVYGIATVGFGLSTVFPLSVALYALVGMADQVSVVSRAQVVQMSTPDELRGRVSSVNMVFIGASNQLSAAEAGFVAALTSPKVSVVSGGAMVLVVVLAVMVLVPALYRWRPPASGASPA